MMLSHSQLRAFHAVAQQGSFTRAAEQLFRSQPAVSDQVRQLEEQFGVLLFNRTKRTVRLTELGEQLLDITKRLYSVAGEAEELLSNSQALQVGSLTLAVDAPVHVLPFITRFRERYPNIHFRVETGNTDDVLARLYDFKADFAVLARSIEEPNLVSEVLSTAPLVAFVPPGHPWFERDSIMLADLDDTPLVLRELGSATRQTLENEMQRIGARLRPAIEVEGREAVIEMVAAGLGVGIVSKAEFSNSVSMRLLPIQDCQQYMIETLVCLRSQSSRRIVEAFLGVVRETLAEKAAAGLLNK